MSANGKNILIIDQSEFSRVCSALLEFEGYCIDIVADINEITHILMERNIRAIVTSYPFSALLFNKKSSIFNKMRIPVIILTDSISEELLLTLEKFQNAYCMIKPLDYHKFKSLVRQVIDGAEKMNGGFRIV